MYPASTFLLNGLRRLRFYSERFAEICEATYPEAGAQGGATVFLDNLFVHIPTAKHDEAARKALEQLVTRFDLCPSPKDVREALATALVTNELNGQNLDFLYAMAKRFIAAPPNSKAEAGSWINRVIYTTVVRIGRERFSMLSTEEWSREVANTIFSDSELSTFEPRISHSPEVTPRPYSDLLNKK